MPDICELGGTRNHLGGSKVCPPRSWLVGGTKETGIWGDPRKKVSAWQGLLWDTSGLHRI